MARLWVHECERVFMDRLVSEADMAKFSEFRVNVTKKFFEDLPQDLLEARPLLHGSFTTQTADEVPVYNSITSYEALRRTLDSKLAEYNESNAMMDLVLFQQVRGASFVFLLCLPTQVPLLNACLRLWSWGNAAGQAHIAPAAGWPWQCPQRTRGDCVMQNPCSAWGPPSRLRQPAEQLHCKATLGIVATSNSPWCLHANYAVSCSWQEWVAGTRPWRPLAERLFHLRSTHSLLARPAALN